MASDFLDYSPLMPAQLGRVGYRNEPPMNGGSAKKPKAPPPAPAPVRADSNAGEQANTVAARRQGLRKTIEPDNPLAPKTSLGTIGQLGMGGEGVMVNTMAPIAPKPKQLPR